MDTVSYLYILSDIHTDTISYPSNESGSLEPYDGINIIFKGTRISNGYL